MKHLFITVIAAVLLAGCTTNVALEKHDWKTVKQEEVDVRSYTLGGEPQMVPVGSTLIRRQKYLTSIMEHSGYVEASNDFVMSTFAGVQHNIKIKGKVPLQIVGRVMYENKSYLVINTGAHLNVVDVGFLLDPTEYSFVQGIKVIKAPRWLIDKTDYLKTTTFSPANTSFNRTRKMIVSDSTRYLNYEIIYSGINNKTISLMYREYDKKDFARTAFFQNVSYTLNDNEPTIIRFKDLEIKVFSAGNEGIVFSVTKDDSQS